MSLRQSYALKKIATIVIVIANDSDCPFGPCAWRNHLESDTPYLIYQKLSRFSISI
jgi:hypothetical protein